MSNGQDVARGFGEFTHLTLDDRPRILKAKLAAGFPHIGIAVPAVFVDTQEFSLCRFNVAMTRYLRRDGKRGFAESPTNGRYYGALQIPVARGDGDKQTMLDWHLPRGTMIEVLIHGDVDLPGDTTVVCYSDEDATTALSVLKRSKRAWNVTGAIPPGAYPENADHRKSVDDFIVQALADPEWRGNGLEFDRL